MAALRSFLLLATVIIFAISIYVAFTSGVNWPKVYFGDILDFGWRSQFNIDFLIHLFLLATWIAWREGFTAKGYIFAFLSIFLGGMFGFPYLIVAIAKAKGDPKAVLLGIHASKSAL